MIVPSGEWTAKCADWQTSGSLVVEPGSVQVPLTHAAVGAVAQPVAQVVVVVPRSHVPGVPPVPVAVVPPVPMLPPVLVAPPVPGAPPVALAPTVPGLPTVVVAPPVPVVPPAVVPPVLVVPPVALAPPLPDPFVDSLFAQPSIAATTDAPSQHHEREERGFRIVDIVGREVPRRRARGSKIHRGKIYRGS